MGWAFADHMKTTLCVGAIQMAFLATGHKGVGNQNRVCLITRIAVANTPAMNTVDICQSSKWNRVWTKKEIVGRACSLDTIPRRNDFSVVLNMNSWIMKKFRTKASAKLSFIDYLAFYNDKRSYSTMGHHSPLHFERDFYRKSVQKSVRFILTITLKGELGDAMYAIQRGFATISAWSSGTAPDFFALAFASFICLFCRWVKSPCKHASLTESPFWKMPLFRDD